MFKYVIVDYNDNDKVAYKSDELFNTYDDAVNAGLEHLDAWEAINEKYGIVKVEFEEV